MRNSAYSRRSVMSTYNKVKPFLLGICVIYGSLLMLYMMVNPSIPDEMSPLIQVMSVVIFLATNILVAYQYHLLQGGTSIGAIRFLRKMKNAYGWTAAANAIVLGLFSLMMFFFATEKGVSAGLHIAACAVLIPVTIWLYMSRIKHVVA